MRTHTLIQVLIDSSCRRDNYACAKCTHASMHLSYMNVHVQTLKKAGYDLEHGFSLAHRCNALPADILQVTIVRGNNLPAKDAGKFCVRIEALLALT
jgi:hypothetical protein